MIRLVRIDGDGSPAEPLPERPPLVEQVLQQNAAFQRATGASAPWLGYVAVEGRRCVGTCAFKSAPRGGRVEIAYFTFPEHEGRGVATAMARALVDVARAAEPGITVTAQTLPAENASTRVLVRLGFVRAGTAVDPEVGTVWEWHLPGP
jgi:RimJ/RimL family protein N-acetyltransferase